MEIKLFVDHPNDEFECHQTRNIFGTFKTLLGVILDDTKRAVEHESQNKDEMLI